MKINHVNQISQLKYRSCSFFFLVAITLSFGSFENYCFACFAISIIYVYVLWTKSLTDVHDQHPDGICLVVFYLNIEMTLDLVKTSKQSQTV